MLPHALLQVVRRPRIKCAIALAREDVGEEYGGSLSYLVAILSARCSRRKSGPGPLHPVIPDGRRDPEKVGIQDLEEPKNSTPLDSGFRRKERAGRFPATPQPDVPGESRGPEMLSSQVNVIGPRSVRC